MLKKIFSIVLLVSMFLCAVPVSATESLAADVLYDMQEKGTWAGTNTSICGTDSTKFPGRGPVIYTAVKKGVGVTIHDSFAEPIKKGKVKISFDFYVDEAYVGYPEFYLSIANMYPVDITKLWNSTPCIFPREDGTIKYYGGYGANSADWTISDTEATVEKGKWYTVENIVNFEEKGRVQGYINGEKLYEIGGTGIIGGLIFNVSGKETSNGKLYFDNIKVSEIKNDLSVDFDYGEGDTAVFEFTQPILAERAKDVKAINILTGEETEILEVEQISAKQISYKMPSGMPYSEYQFTFGEKNVSDFGAGITGSITVNGTVGISDAYKTEVLVQETMIEDTFDSYAAMDHTVATWTPDVTKWSKIGNTWWGMGPMINSDKKMQIQTFYGDQGSKSGVKGKILDVPQTDGKVEVSFDLSFDEYDATEGNSVRIDMMSGDEVFPVLEVKGTSVAVYSNQNEGETPEVLSQIAKENNATALTYRIGLDFTAGIISVKIGDVVIPDITMNSSFKDAGVTDIAFVGCRNVANGSEEECNGALIDNFSAAKTKKEYLNCPAVAGVRFVERDGEEKTALDTISPLTEKIRIKFSKAMKVTDLDQIAIANADGEISCGGNWDADNNVWEMTIPNKALKVKREHTLCVPAGISDSDELSLVGEYLCRFQVGANSRAVNISYINEFAEQNDKLGLAALLSDDSDNLGIVSGAFQDADKAELAEAIIDYVQEEGALNDSDSTVKVLQKLVLMECANNNRSACLWDNDLSYGISDAGIVALMEERLCRQVTQQIAEKEFLPTEIERFDIAIRDAVILTGIKYADGSDRVKSILNTFETEIGDGEALAITADKCIAVYEEANFKSLAELKSFIKSYQKQPNPGDSPKGGASFGGGFVSSNTGNAAMVADNKVFENKEDDGKNEVPIFSDIAEYPWAKEAIEGLFAKGIIAGREKNLFVPEASILREETAKIIVEAFRFYIKGEIEFDDVKENDWFYPYIVRAYNSGVVSGISKNEFGSGQMILRQDLAVMVYNALVAAGVSCSDEAAENLFIDHADISDYAVQAIYALKDKQIISGDQNNAFNPSSYASRAETAKIVYLAMQYLK